MVIKIRKSKRRFVRLQINEEEWHSLLALLKIRPLTEDEWDFLLKLSKASGKSIVKMLKEGIDPELALLLKINEEMN